MRTVDVEKQFLPRLPRPSANSPSSAAARWQAIVNRDTTVHSFVYGVRTTGIYCRPSCPARLARRANIEFYDSPTQAETAGYRPCKRCSPQFSVRIDPHILSVQKACETIASACDSGEKPLLSKLAAEAKLSPSHFHRVFKKIVGVTPSRYAMNIKRKYPRVELETPDDRMTGNDYENAIQLEEDTVVDPLQHHVPDAASHGTSRTLHDHIDPNTFDLMMTAEDTRLNWDSIDSLDLSLIGIPETIQNVIGTSRDHSVAEPTSDSGNAASAVRSWEDLDLFEYLEDSMYQT